MSEKTGLMQRFMDWMSTSVSPKLEKLTENAWISGLQKAIMRTIPMVLVGSVVTVYNVVRNFLPGLPNLGPISTYTFGLYALFMVFLIPFYILEIKGVHKTKFIAGLTGIALFFILVNPEITDAGYVYNITSFGAGGMIVAIVAGMFTAAVMLMFRKLTFFGEDSVMPDFVREWFDAMLPIFVVVFAGWLVVVQLGFDMYTAIVTLFTPLINMAQSLPGILLLYLLPTILYSMGISGWVFQPILNPVTLMGIEANAQALAAGLTPEYVYVSPTVTAFLSLGGRGMTLSLVILMILSKSKRLKALGTASSLPSLLNINEPVVFGAVAWNPTLMVPMWINAIVIPTVTYIVMKVGLVQIPAEVFSLWYCPVFLSSWLVSRSFSGLLLTAINLAISFVIWYPFFKLQEAKEIEKELEKAAK